MSINCSSAAMTRLESKMTQLARCAAGATPTMLELVELRGDEARHFGAMRGGRGGRHRSRVGILRNEVVMRRTGDVGRQLRMRQFNSRVGDGDRHSLAQSVGPGRARIDIHARTQAVRVAVFQRPLACVEDDPSAEWHTDRPGRPVGAARDSSPGLRAAPPVAAPRGRRSGRPAPAK